MLTVYSIEGKGTKVARGRRKKLWLQLEDDEARGQRNEKKCQYQTGSKGRKAERECRRHAQGEGNTEVGGKWWEMGRSGF